MLKKLIITKTKDTYILADSSKFNQISNIKFANINDATIITDEFVEDFDYAAYGNVYAVKDQRYYAV